MKSIVQPNFRCAFVNTLTPPISTTHVSYFVTEGWNGNEKYLLLWEIIDAVYPHPDTPEDANIPVLTNRLIKSVKESNGGEVLLLKEMLSTVYKLNKE